MRCIIAGTRTITDPADLAAGLASCPWADEIREVVSGGADGVDKLGEAWATTKGLPIRRHLPDWQAHGRAAGPIRNGKMGDDADALLALWDGLSRGTASMITEAARRHLLTHIHPVPPRRPIWERQGREKWVSDGIELRPEPWTADGSGGRQRAWQIWPVGGEPVRVGVQAFIFTRDSRPFIHPEVVKHVLGRATATLTRLRVDALRERCAA